MLLRDITLEGPARRSASPPTVDLLVWVRHFVAIATANFLYSPEKPLSADPSLEASFWDFDHGLGPLMMGILPSVTARRPHLGRETLTRALVSPKIWLRSRRLSGLIEDRYRFPGKSNP
jgi:hypothetical protein